MRQTFSDSFWLGGLFDPIPRSSDVSPRHGGRSFSPLQTNAQDSHQLSLPLSHLANKARRATKFREHLPLSADSPNRSRMRGQAVRSKAGPKTRSDRTSHRRVSGLRSRVRPNGGCQQCGPRYLSARRRQSAARNRSALGTPPHASARHPEAEILGIFKSAQPSWGPWFGTRKSQVQILSPRPFCFQRLTH